MVRPARPSSGSATTLACLLAVLPGGGSLAQTTAPPAPVVPPSSTAMPDAAPAHAGAAAQLTELVLAAHPVVQGVMALLALAAFAVLVVLIHKSVALPLARGRLAARLAALDLDLPPQAVSGADPGARMINLAATRPGAALLALMCREIEAEALAAWKSGTGLLTQIAATAPFVGLFGTVFGIMNAFLAIAATRTTNLAVVAPGIAEALFATALGLVAAIPAVWVHNHLTRRIAANRALLARLAARVEHAAAQPVLRRKEAA